MDIFKILGTVAINTDEANNDLDQISGHAEKTSGKIGTALGKVGAFVGKATLAAAGAAIAGISAITKSAVENYAEYEQLVGGVETLFDSSDQFEAYKTQMLEMGYSMRTINEEIASMKSGSDIVLENAANAYKTAGMSANDYMETVTSFSASLIQSLGGDTIKAADYADMAITDMSDNANKMGTSMESIQNAYQGFAKQNYTMLDNLKLGYGGTGSEMERLITDAEKLDSSFKASRDANGDLTMSYADIVDAIHIVQTEMGITGTTAAEASTTIQGSIGSMKAAWQNWLTSLADSNGDVVATTTQLVDSATTVLGNIVPVVGQVFTNIAPIIAEKAPELISQLVTIITDNLPLLIESGVGLLAALITGLVQAIPQLVEAIPEIITGIVQAFEDSWPQLKQAGIDALNALWEGIKSIGSSIGEWISGWWSSLWSGKDAGAEMNAITESGGKSGSFASGLDYVPYNNYPAMLHEGEAVLTSSEADAWRNGDSGGGETTVQPVEIPVALSIDGMTLARQLYKYNVKVSRNHGLSMSKA